MFLRLLYACLPKPKYPVRIFGIITNGWSIDRTHTQNKYKWFRIELINSQNRQWQKQIDQAHHLLLWMWTNCILSLSILNKRHRRRSVLCCVFHFALNWSEFKQRPDLRNTIISLDRFVRSLLVSVCLACVRVSLFFFYFVCVPFPKWNYVFCSIVVAMSLPTAKNGYIYVHVPDIRISDCTNSFLFCFCLFVCRCFRSYQPATMNIEHWT